MRVRRCEAELDKAQRETAHRGEKANEQFKVCFKQVRNAMGAENGNKVVQLE